MLKESVTTRESKKLGNNNSSFEEKMNTIVKLFNEQKYSEAESFARDFSNEFHDSGIVWLALGVAILNQNRPKDALLPIENAVILIPENAEAYFNRGRVHIALNDFDAALLDCLHAIQLDPQMALAYSNLSLIYCNLEIYENALKAGNKAIELNPNLWHAHVNLALAHCDLEEFEQALMHSQKAIDLNPGCIEAWFNAGIALEGLNETDGAINKFNQALLLNKSFVYANLKIIEKYIRDDDIEAASQLLNRLKRDGFINGDLHYLNGRLEKINFNIDAACNLFLKAVQLKSQKTYRTESALNLSIYAYLNNDMQMAFDMLKIVKETNEKKSEKYKFSQAYYRFLDALYGWKLNCSPQKVGGSFKILYVIGESHCLCAHDIYIEFIGEKYKTRSYWIEGCKQWHIGINKFQYTNQFELIVSTIPSGSPVLISIGEIDCRVDNGIFEYAKKNALNVESVALQTFDRYLNYVSDCATRKNLDIIISGVPAVNSNLEKLNEFELQSYLKFIKFVNFELQRKVIALGMKFLDVFSMTRLDDGLSNKNWHIDNIHLRPDGIVKAFECHLIIPSSHSVKIRDAAARTMLDVPITSSYPLNNMAAGHVADIFTNFSDCLELNPPHHQSTSNRITTMTTITIDNVEYDFDKLSEETKAQLISMQFCDQELQRLQSQAAAIQTARQAYAKALQASLAAEAIQGDKISFN